MLEPIFLSTAFIGSTLAAFYDLKTTEIPDEIPYAMIAVALVLYAAQSYLAWSYWPVLNSLIAGLSLLGFGFLMYYLGQWGGGDAKVLSAIGFLIPSLTSSRLLFPFPLSYLINVFLIGAAYMLVYALILALINRKIIFEFSKDVRASSKVLSIGSMALFLAFFSINYFLTKYFMLDLDFLFILRNSALPLLATLALFIIWKFARTVENVGFKKRIPVSKLKVGDVLLESKLWEGLTDKELKKIKKSGKKFVVVKEGVRFAMSFPLALLFTLYFGDGFLLFVKFLI